ncbi:hypothetical protein AUJ17_05050 [Candidatus Micrarchaeota archaeon CG1_02_47_40]|nr:MAG: hypothetical protein AUJ17_05050 [Candidatus Micrarchaeota archaeon CG1_02_47_40]
MKNKLCLRFAQVCRKPSVSSIAFVIVCALLLRLIFAFLFPIPASGDEMWHYLVSESFTKEKWLTAPYIDNYWGHVEVPQGTSYRPPLFNFMVGGAMMLFGSSFFLMQMLNVLIGTAVVLAVYLVAKKLFEDENVAIASALFTAINPVFISLSIGGEVRMFFALLFLISVYFWLEGRKGLAGIFCGLCVLTHQMGLALAIGYGILMIADLMGKRKGIGAWLKETASFFAPSLLAILILLAINFALFADVFYSTSKYVPLITNWNEMQKLAPPKLENFNWGAAISNTLQNTARTFLPLPFSRVDGGLALDFNFITNTNLNYNSLASITTLVLLAGAVVYAYERKKDAGLLASMFFGGLFLAVLSLHWPTTYAYAFLFGTSFLAIIFGFGRILEEKKERRNLLAFVAVLLLMQFVIFLNRPAEKPSVIEWMETNIAQNERIMSSDCLEIAFYTGKACFVTPAEDDAIIRNTASKYAVEYFVQRKKEGELPHCQLVFEGENWFVCLLSGTP